eukprot:TRINITY_DN19678_c0_g1_i1.p1 TRINITY_DN19678_c0_g1~~TRINITY_DN19678_c0_g1_i1.p1  ORF type:complete len:277 (-),score=16.54 TRINITY_DN19678_c0_g1_i1:34-864(-)
MFFFFLMIRRPPRSTHCISSAASDVYKRQINAEYMGYIVYCRLIMYVFVSETQSIYKTMEKNKKLEFVGIVVMILAAALSRLIPHPYNFSPICAMALFGSAYLNNRYYCYIIPIASMWISDLLLNNIIYAAYFDHFIWFYDGAIVTYAAFLLISLLGRSILHNKIALLRLFCTSILSSIIFFLISNFGVWLFSSMLPYPHTFGGLISCYIAGIPFFRNTLLGDFFYIFLMFGVYELLIKLSLIHISEPTRLGMISYAVFCLKKKKKNQQIHSVHTN